MGSVAHNGVCRAIDLGVVDYDDAFALQKAHVERLQRDEGDDVLIFLEHPHVITVGRNATGRAIVADRHSIEARGARVVATDRGGDVTYHGPGQLVGYPIVRLEMGRRDIRRYVHDLEQVLIDTLADFDVEASRATRYTAACGCARRRSLRSAFASRAGSPRTALHSTCRPTSRTSGS